MKNKKLIFITRSALIAAIYVVLTYLTSLIGLDKFAIQCRFSEALCILPFFTPAAIPGLSIGCIIANLISGSHPLDVVFGSLATLIGAFIASKIKIKWLVPLPNIIANTIIVPSVIVSVYGAEFAFPLVVLFVFLGEVVSCYVIGMLLLLALEKHKSIFSK